MAAERPSIQHVKNDIITVSLPFLDDTIQTYLTADVAAAGTALTVKDNSGFSDNDYIIIGNIGEEQTELKQVNAAVSAGTSITSTAVTFPHSAGTKVTLIRYNQVALYGSSSASDSSPTIIGSATGLDVSKGEQEMVASTTYAYYYARYYNSETTTYSSYSDSAAATGLSSKARGEIKKEFLSIYNERIDDLITDEWLNRAINRWQRELNKRRKQWACLRASTITDTTEDTQKYSLPTDIYDNDSNDSIVSIKFYNQPWLVYVDHEVYDGITYDWIGTTLDGAITSADTTIDLTDASDFASSGNIYIAGDAIAYTGKSSNQLTGVTGIQSAGHSDDAEVWQTYDDGQPVKYTVNNGYFYLNPLPDNSNASKNLYLEYWKKFPDLSDDSDETLFHSPENCYFYLHWQASIRRRMEDGTQNAREARWRTDLEHLVAEDPDFSEVRIHPRNFYKYHY
jgi:hypothetical protein